MGKRSARKRAKKRYAYYANRGRQMPQKPIKYCYTEHTSGSSYTSNDDFYRRQQQIIDDTAACIPFMMTTMM